MRRVLCLVVCFLLIFNVVRVAMQLQRDPTLTPEEYEYLSVESALHIIAEYEYAVGNSLNKFVDLYDKFEQNFNDVMKEEGTTFEKIIDWFKNTLLNSIPFLGGSYSFDFMTSLFDFIFALFTDFIALFSMAFDLVSALFGFREYAPTT